MTPTSAARQVTLVVEIPAVVTDPEWDDQMLVDNAVDWLSYLVHKAVKRNEAEHGAGAYTLSSDLTVWTIDGYTADLNDLQSPPAETPV